MSSFTSPSGPASPVPDGLPELSQTPRDQSNPIVAIASSQKKEKVSWVGDPEDRSPPGEDDYVSTILISHSRKSIPGVPARRNDFDKAHLITALEEILKAEHHAGPHAAPSLRAPKPALRKNQCPKSPTEATGGLSHPSEVEARHRVGRLAESVSGLASRMEVGGGEPLNMAQLDGDGLCASGAHDHVSVKGTGTGTGTGDEVTDHQSVLKFRPRLEANADRLTRSYTKRPVKKLPSIPLAQGLDAAHRPGTAAAVESCHDGETLGSLQLYKYSVKDRIQSAKGTSQNTGSRTPNRMPRNPPPRSAPPSDPGTPRLERPDSGLLEIRCRHSASTFAELVGSSSTLALQAMSNKEWSDMGSEMPRREWTDGDRSNKDEKPSEYSSQQQTPEPIHIGEKATDVASRHRYMLKLCRALMEFGAPTHRLEAYMAMSARVLAIQGQFLYIPGCMIISFGDTETQMNEVKIVRVSHGVDLGKLRDVHEIYKLVCHDLIGVGEAISRLDAVVIRTPKFDKCTRVLVYGIAAASVAPFAFEGRWIDLPVVFVMGCVLGFMQLIAAPSSQLYSNIFEISASLLMSFLGRMIGSIRYNGESLFCFSALAQSSIALILPGYMVLCGSLELQSQNMIAGSARMVYASAYTLFLGYGVTIGTVLYGLMDEHATSSTSCSEPLSRYWNLLFVPLFTLSLCIINQAKWKQLPVMIAISFAGYVVNDCTHRYLRSSIVSNTLGALTIGVLANLYSRLSVHAENLWLSMKPWRVSRDLENGGISGLGEEEDGVRSGRRFGVGLAATAMLPALFVQVPSGLASSGSLVSGVTSADAIIGHKLEDSQGTADLNTGAFTVLLSVIEVAISISVGLSLAALLVYPLGKRRSGLFSF